MSLKLANDLDFNAHKAINLDDGVDPEDGVNLSQLDANATADRNRSNHTGTQLASTISNFTAAVQAIEWRTMVAPTAAVNGGSQKYENLADPVAGTDAVNLNTLNAAVAGIAGGLAFKGVAQVVHTANVNTANPGTSTFDGETITSGQVVILDGQSTGSQDGPWTFTGSGTAMTRPTNWDTIGEAVVGSFWVVTRGVQADKFAIMSNDTFTLGTDEPDFVFVGASSVSNASSYAQDVGTGSAGPYNIPHNLSSEDVSGVLVKELAGDHWVLVDWNVVDADNIALNPDETWATSSHRVVVSVIT